MLAQICFVSPKTERSPVFLGLQRQTDSKLVKKRLYVYVFVFYLHTWGILLTKSKDKMDISELIGVHLSGFIKPNVRLSQ